MLSVTVCDYFAMHSPDLVCHSTRQIMWVDEHEKRDCLLDLLNAAGSFRFLLLRLIAMS